MAFAEAEIGLESIKIVFGGNATSKGLTMRCSAFVEFGIRLAGEKEKGNMAIKLLKRILDRLPFVYCTPIHVAKTHYGFIEHTEYIYGCSWLGWNDVLCTIRVFQKQQ